jgi:ABC-2 type transport system permease protein
MTSTVAAPPPVVETPLRPGAAELRVVSATIRASLLRYASNPIMMLRGPIVPALMLVSFHLVYQVSGQTEVAGVDAMSFLVVGMLGTLAWSSTVWGSGNALQAESYLGTISAVVAAPGSLVGVIAGYGLANMIFGLPALAVCIATGYAFGAETMISSPVAAIVALGSLYACCLCIGIGFGGVFILSRQSNALSNFLQGPIYLLAGFYVPRDALPEWLYRVSDVLPISHSIEAIRAAVLSGASLADITDQLAATAVTSVVFLLIGVAGLRHLDEVVRRRGTMDLL